MSNAIFIDTSALIALLDADDECHAKAADIWTRLVEGADELISTSYVLIESFALSQSHLGPEASETLAEDVIPLLRTIWVEPAQRAELTAAFKEENAPKSLTDCASFDTMRRNDVTKAFTFDPQFAEQGFEQID